MFSEQPRHYSSFYREFRSIDAGDKQRIIRQYEEKEQEIGRLDPLENFELTVLYVDALFATGAHRKHLMMVDLVIFISIDQNIQYLDGQDVYERMLFRKAASAFRVLDYKSCAYVARELIKLYPREQLYPRLLRTALFWQEKNWLQVGRAGAIIAVLLTALLIVIDWLVVQPFYPAEHEKMLTVGVSVFSFGLLFFAGCYGFAYFRADRGVRKFIATRKTKNK